MTGVSMHRLIPGILLFSACLFGVSATTAHAQILIWSLPKDDGAWVRFEGTYKLTESRPESNAGDETLDRRTELMISSVGRVNAPFQGADVPCRWVEFKTVTKPNDLEKQPGPAGVYWYKVLIPESRVIGKSEDSDGIPVRFLPIVKGYRKIGSRAVEAVSERALAVYPTIAPVTYYPNLKVDPAEPAEIQLPITNEPIAVKVHKGVYVHQNNLMRSTNAGALWLSDKVPFGLARYQVTLTREEKALTASVDEFRRKSLAEVEVSAVAQGNDAKSELPDSN
jgi:hypothetical protein